MSDWNGPTVLKSQAFIEKSLYRHFGGKIKIGGSKLGIASFCQSSGGQGVKLPKPSQFCGYINMTMNTITFYLSRGIKDYAVPV